MNTSRPGNHPSNNNSAGGTGARPAPGDDAKPGTPGTGENVCPECRGSGKIGGNSCPNCKGTGKIVEGIGGG